MNNVYLKQENFIKENMELGSILPYSENVSALAQKATVHGKAVHNRLACQAMEGCDGTFDGRPDELTKRRYRRFAEGGAGIIWFEATSVMPEGRANPRQLYINEENLDSFKAVVDEIRETSVKKNGYAPLIFMQATHSGRYSKPNGKPEPLIAYNNPIFEKNAPISEDSIVSDSYIDSVCEALVNGARLAEMAGFDGVDIKCCHRYLASELLSAYERNGRYGGSFENRTRLLREAVQGAIQRCKSDFIVSSRLNAYDGFPYPYGFGVAPDGSLEPDLTETKELLRLLSSYGVEIVNITMGNPYFNPHVNRPFASGSYTPPEHPLKGVARMLNGTAELKKSLPEMKIICSALSFLGVSAPNVAASYIQNGAFDFAGFGRTVFAYPSFASDILKNGAMSKDKCCIACSKCTEIMRAGGTTGCVIKDSETYLPIYKQYCQSK